MFAASTAERVLAYHQPHAGGTTAMAVLVQAMVDPMAAGVAFTAHPVTGDRDQVASPPCPAWVIRWCPAKRSARWTITTRDARMSRPMPVGGKVLTAGQAQAVADLARKVADRYQRPQDIEWAIDQEGRLWLLQARPMTALPESVSWTAPGPGLWMRNFRLGEWLPEAVTPLFATWLLPELEDGYLDGMHETVRVRVPFRYALVNGWYYNAVPIPSPKLLLVVVARAQPGGQDRLQRADPPAGTAAADRAVLSDLDRQWRDPPARLPAARRRRADRGHKSSPDRLAQLVDQLGRRPEYACGIWRSSAGRHGKWRAADALLPSAPGPRVLMSRAAPRCCCAD